MAMRLFSVALATLLLATTVSAYMPTIENLYAHHPFSTEEPLAFSNDGEYLLLGNNKGDLVIMSTDGTERHYAFSEFVVPGNVSVIAVNPVGNYAAVAVAAVIHFVDFNLNKVSEHTLTLNSSVEHMTFSPQGDYFGATSSDRVYTYQISKNFYELEAPTTHVDVTPKNTNGIGFYNDNSLVLAVGTRVEVYGSADTSLGTPVTFNHHNTGTIAALAITYNDYVVTVDDANTLGIVHGSDPADSSTHNIVANGTHIGATKRQNQGEDPLAVVAFGDNTFKIFNLLNPASVTDFVTSTGIAGSISTVATSEYTFATASDTTVEFWAHNVAQPPTATTVLTFANYNNNTYAKVAISAERNLLISVNGNFLERSSLNTGIFGTITDNQRDLGNTILDLVVHDDTAWVAVTGDVLKKVDITATPMTVDDIGSDNPELLALSEDGLVLAYCSNNKDIKTVNTTSDAISASALALSATEAVTALALNSDGSKGAAARDGADTISTFDAGAAVVPSNEVPIDLSGVTITGNIVSLKYFHGSDAFVFNWDNTYGIVNADNSLAPSGDKDIGENVKNVFLTADDKNVLLVGGSKYTVIDIASTEGIGTQNLLANTATGAAMSQDGFWFAVAFGSSASVSHTCWGLFNCASTCVKDGQYLVLESQTCANDCSTVSPLVEDDQTGTCVIKPLAASLSNQTCSATPVIEYINSSATLTIALSQEDVAGPPIVKNHVMTLTYSEDRSDPKYTGMQEKYYFLLENGNLSEVTPVDAAADPVVIKIGHIAFRNLDINNYISNGVHYYDTKFVVALYDSCLETAIKYYYYNFMIEENLYATADVNVVSTAIEDANLDCDTPAAGCLQTITYTATLKKMNSAFNAEVSSSYEVKNTAYVLFALNQAVGESIEVTSIKAILPNGLYQELFDTVSAASGIDVATNHGEARITFTVTPSQPFVLRVEAKISNAEQGTRRILAELDAGVSGNQVSAETFIDVITPDEATHRASSDVEDSNKNESSDDTFMYLFWITFGAIAVYATFNVAKRLISGKRASNGSNRSTTTVELESVMP